VTRLPGGPYASPDALRAAVTTRAKAAARADPRFTVTELLRQFAYARLLARVFIHEPEGWVLKGGIGLLARLPRTRHSMDVDLWSRASPCPPSSTCPPRKREGFWQPEDSTWKAERQNLSHRSVQRSQPMRALVADPSASPALSLADVPEPSPGPGQLLVRMEAASVNRGEIRTAAKQPPGRVIGWDIAGSVVALGEGVSGFEVGQRVLAVSPTGGAFAELAAVPAAWTMTLPSAADPVLAAALPVAGVTAMNILRLARVHAGDRVLVTGAAGGVGMLAVQLALDAKATVIGQASSEQRAAAVRELGAEALIHPGDGSAVDGEFDVALDAVGGPMLAPLLRATGLGGRVVVYGNSADAESTFRVEEFYPKAITIYGFRIFQSVPPEQGIRDLATLAEQTVEGRLRITVQATAPLSEALPLVRDLYDRRVTGKVVITFEQ
jgi:NADPH2:quinone reductase